MSESISYPKATLRQARLQIKGRNAVYFELTSAPTEGRVELDWFIFNGKNLESTIITSSESEIISENTMLERDITLTKIHLPKELDNDENIIYTAVYSGDRTLKEVQIGEDISLKANKGDVIRVFVWNKNMVPQK